MEKNLQNFLVAIALCMAGAVPLQAKSGYVAGDFHQHSTYTDGSYSIGLMMQKNNQFGLDWWANSEHGGAFASWGLVTGIDLKDTATVAWANTGINILGKSNNGKMWRWQSLRDWNFRDVLLYRQVYPEKLIIQGYEMNVPGHEHASTAIIASQFDATNPNAEPLAQFEYMFDNNDTDDSQPEGWVKSTKSGHEKALEALTWLQTNYPTQSWVIPAHPERYRYTGSTGWNIEHFRDLNNVAPDVFFGFESIPGHQMSSRRGEYGSTRPSYGLNTYGGAGLMCARVGGLWDAMLSEGRKFWLFANSDCHNNSSNGGGDFFPGEYEKNYTYVTDSKDAQAIADGLRSGNTYCVMGDLIDSLNFTIGTASMGGVYETSDGVVTLSILVRDPQTNNNNTYSSYTNPELDHIDIIAGAVGSKIQPTDSSYTVDTVTTTKVIARFGKNAGYTDTVGIATQAWTDKGSGWKEIKYVYNVPAGEELYFRLRGTNYAVNTAGETDSYGNPIMDAEGQNNATKAFGDLWFYSNPVYALSTDTAVTLADSIKMQTTIAMNALNAGSYALPDYTLLRRAYTTVQNTPTADNQKAFSEAITTVRSKEEPYNVCMSINGDPSTRLGFSWFTNLGIENGMVQIVSGAVTDTTLFSAPAFTLNADTLNIWNLNYTVSSNGLSNLAGIADNTKHSYTTHKALATGLTPNTTYSYRVGKPGDWSEIGTFTTATSGKDAYSFLYIADTQAMNDDYFSVSEQTVKTARTMLPDARFCMMTGDMVESSGSSNSEWEWEQWFELMQPVWKGLPIAPICGNHDKSANKNLTNHFNTEKTSFDTQMSTSPGSVYSFVYGDALYIAASTEDYSKAGYLDSLKNFVRTSVAAHPEVKWKIAFFHKTIYTGSKSHQSDADGKTVRDSLAPVFDEVGIDLAFQGHDHIYEVIGANKNYQLAANSNKGVQTVTGGVRENMTGKEGGIFNVQNGTLYFLNNSAGKKKYEPRSESEMEAAIGSHGITNYWGMFTGKFGQTGEPTFSDVKVTSDTIFISTYTVNTEGVASLFDSFKVVKTTDFVTSLDSQTAEKMTVVSNTETSSLTVRGLSTVDKMDLYNMSGVLVGSVSNTTVMSVASQSTGVYLLKVLSGDDLYVEQVQVP
jgi:acid phosphatase type 7